MRNRSVSMSVRGRNWTGLFALVTLGIATSVALPCLGISDAAAEEVVPTKFHAYIFRKGPQISQLVLRKKKIPLYAVAGKDGERTPFVYLEGRLKMKDWSLVFFAPRFESQQSPNQGQFRISVPLYSDKTVLEISAVTPLGQVYKEPVHIVLRAGTVQALQGTSSTPEKEAATLRKARWSLIGRLAQSVAAYSVDDVDLGKNSGGAALTGGASAELRWQGGKKEGQNWTWSGSLNIEGMRQLILSETFLLPGAYGRVFLGREKEKWRVGPFLQAGIRKSAIFVVESESVAKNLTPLRPGFGLGGVAVYKASNSLGLSALGLLRYDLGTSGGTQLPNPVDGNFSFEFGFGMVATLSERVFLEGRVRAVQDNASWKAATPSSIGDTSRFSTNFAMIDVGFGYRL